MSRRAEGFHTDRMASARAIARHNAVSDALQPTRHQRVECCKGPCVQPITSRCHWLRGDGPPGGDCQR